MARVAKKAVTQHFKEERDIQSLSVSKTFIYEVDIFRITDKSFNLEESKYVSSAKFSEDVKESFVKDEVNFKRDTKLISAPIEWLKEKGYKE